MQEKSTAAVEYKSYCKCLIDLVKPHVLLYQKDHFLYKNARKRNEAWKQIQEELVRLGFERKHAVRARDRFRRLMSRFADEVNTASGWPKEANYESTFHHYEAMSYIAPYIQIHTRGTDVNDNSKPTSAVANEVQYTNSEDETVKDMKERSDLPQSVNGNLGYVGKRSRTAVEETQRISTKDPAYIHQDSYTSGLLANEPSSSFAEAAVKTELLSNFIYSLTSSLSPAELDVAHKKLRLAATKICAQLSCRDYASEASLFPRLEDGFKNGIGVEAQVDFSSDNVSLCEENGQQMIRIDFDARGIKPEEITASTDAKSNSLTLQIHHREDNYTIQLSRRFRMPDGALVKDLKCFLTSDGVLRIQVLCAPSIAEVCKEMEISVKHE